MDKLTIKRKDKKNDKNISGWPGALADAEERVKRTRRELEEWKAVARVCRERIAQQAPWPGESAVH
jgi:hypothetical protein